MIVDSVLITNKQFYSPLVTTELRDNLKLPTCEYSVRRDGINGPQLTFANVGETVRLMIKFRKKKKKRIAVEHENLANKYLNIKLYFNSN